MQIETLTPFVSKYFFRDICIMKALEKKGISPSEEKVGILTAYYKRYGSLISDFSPIIQGCLCRHLSGLIWEGGGAGEIDKNIC